MTRLGIMVHVRPRRTFENSTNSSKWMGPVELLSQVLSNNHEQLSETTIKKPVHEEEHTDTIFE